MPRLGRCAPVRELAGRQAVSAIGFSALNMAANGARRLCDTELRSVRCNSSALRSTSTSRALSSNLARRIDDATWAATACKIGESGPLILRTDRQ